MSTTRLNKACEVAKHLLLKGWHALQCLLHEGVLGPLSQPQTDWEYQAPTSWTLIKSAINHHSMILERYQAYGTRLATYYLDLIFVLVSRVSQNHQVQSHLHGHPLINKKKLVIATQLSEALGNNSLHFQWLTIQVIKKYVFEKIETAIVSTV